MLTTVAQSWPWGSLGHGAVKLQRQIVCTQEILSLRPKGPNAVERFGEFLLLNTYSIKK